MNSDLLSKFEFHLNSYFNSEKLQELGLPVVSYFSDQLNLSSNYFSDLIKKETSSSANEHIQLKLIKKPKGSNNTVSEIAYELGFEHPPYFTRLFKKRTGVTPIEFCQSVN
ncbi:MAG: helix-turn-helix transcriptional regulator [Cytophagales bacterium]|nr:helix-turn-helix transcriptional regulator [Cytophagales bacterium]